MRSLVALAFVVSLLACSKGDSSSPPPQPTKDAGTPVVDIDDFVRGLPASCAFDCKKGCPEERLGPFACPAMGAWETLPHEAACGGPPSFPAAVAGKCSIGAPTGEALLPSGPIAGKPGSYVLPDGHRITPLGVDRVLESTNIGGFPVAIAIVPTTQFAVVVDAGYGDHLVRTIDLDALHGGTAPFVVSTVVLPRANWGVAVVAAEPAKHRVYVSGGDSGKIWALTVDDVTGVLTKDDGRTIDLGTVGSGAEAIPFFSAGIAISPDEKRLVVASVRFGDARIVSLEAATHGNRIALAALGRGEQFTVAIDPTDLTGSVGYATLWADAKLVAFDMATGAVKQTIALGMAGKGSGKNPQGMAFLDGRWMVVAASDADALVLVDRVAGVAVTTIPIATGTASVPASLRGWSPTNVAFDAKSKRLYVTESVVNAIEVLDVDIPASGTPILTSKGRMPTAWWPTDVAIDERTGRLIVVDGRGHGTGPGMTGKPMGFHEGEIAESMRGSLQSIDLTEVDLLVTTKQVEQNAALAQTAGYPTPTCEAGAKDFPVPVTNTEGPSTRIKHVILIVRENKCFDAVFGDVPGVAGKAANVIAPGRMETLYANFRAIGKRWTIADNYYTDAEFSSQGHVWTTYGRTTDFTERIWMIGAAGKGREVGGGITDVGRAEEGSVFEWLLREKVEFDILGEGTGLPAPPKDVRNPLDKSYPGIAQNIGLEDVTKSCYFAARARARCDLHDFVYMTLPNDHTFGGGAGRPSPETMVAVNDEATGNVLDALGRSPFWKDTLVMVTEDDPQDGADHIDLHRTPLIFAGPFVKKGYVAKGHYDVASLVKLIAHIRGLPYPNAVVARAPLPLEMFTSTPDYTPYVVMPRTHPLTCNGEGGKFATEAAGWDFDEIDEQPGLGKHVAKMLKLTPEQRGDYVAPMKK